MYSFHTELNCDQCHIGNGKLRIKLLLKTPFWQENNEKKKIHTEIKCEQKKNNEEMRTLKSAHHLFGTILLSVGLLFYNLSHFSVP